MTARKNQFKIPEPKDESFKEKPVKTEKEAKNISEDLQVDTLNVLPLKKIDEQDLMLTRNRQQKDFHNHDGTNSELVSVKNLIEFIETVTTIPTVVPRKFWEQFKIYTDSLTAPTITELYFYDTGNGEWKSTVPAVITKARARVYLSGLQNVSNASLTRINFDTENWDVGANFVSNEFIAPRDGYYLVNLSVEIETVDPADLVEISIRIEGTIKSKVRTRTNSTADTESFSVSATVFCNKDESITGRIYHEFGETVDLQGSQTKSYITIDEL